MTETRHICDKCKTVILEDRTMLTVESGPDALVRPELELCLSCWRALLATLAVIDQKSSLDFTPVRMVDRPRPAPATPASVEPTTET
jgi:hypothetical protein